MLETESKSDFPQIREGFKDLAANLDTAALELLENARKVAQLLGAQVIDPAHVVLAKLLLEYQAVLGGKPDRSNFQRMVSMVSPQTRTFNPEQDRTLPPTQAMRLVLLRAQDSANLQERIGTNKLFWVIQEIDRPTLSSALSYIGSETLGTLRKTRYEQRIRNVLASIAPRPLFGQPKPPKI